MHTPVEAEAYTIKGISKCLILNYENFKQNNDEYRRKGTQKDVELLRETFENLGFDVDIKNDQTREETVSILRSGKYAQMRSIQSIFSYFSEAARDHTREDCLVIFFLSHGNETRKLLFVQCLLMLL